MLLTLHPDVPDGCVRDYFIPSLTRQDTFSREERISDIRRLVAVWAGTSFSVSDGCYCNLFSSRYGSSFRFTSDRAGG